MMGGMRTDKRRTPTQRPVLLILLLLVAVPTPAAPREERFQDLDLRLGSSGIGVEAGRPIQTTIPFTMNRGHMVIAVEIRGRELQLTLDNGNVRAPTILYGSPKIDSLDLAFDGQSRPGAPGPDRRRHGV